MFVANTALSHAANSFCCLQKGQVRTFRGYMKPTIYGAFSWRFTYQNTVDSTWADGTRSRADLPGGHFRILHADICVCDAQLQVLAACPVHFDAMHVLPNAQVQTEPVSLAVAPDGYIMFHWCLEALEDNCVIPATPDSRAPVYTAEKDLSADAPLDYLRPLDEAAEEPGALPWLWAVERQVQYRMAFIGDSITQGCQTRIDRYEQWAARIIRSLPNNVSGLNIGLGYARAQDAARNGTWLKKLTDCDVINVCLGINDILQLAHLPNRAEIVTRSLETTVQNLRKNLPTAKVVLFTIPPFSLKEASEQVRTQVNTRIRHTKLGADAVFDMEILAVPGSHGQARFGAHPNSAGGAVVAQDYLTRFLPQNKHTLFP